MVAQNQSSYYRVPYPTTNKGRYENGYKFNGKELDDATQMYYFSARYMDPRLSIFISVDPLAEETMTPYQYVHNNPVNMIDPTGMKGEDWVYNKETEQYHWDNAVNKPSDVTDPNLEYVGPSTSDVNAHFKKNNPVMSYVTNPEYGESKNGSWPGEIKTDKPTTADSWAEGNLAQRMVYETVNSFSVTTQSLNPFDNNVTTLRGENLDGMDRSIHGANVAATAIPIGKGVQYSGRGLKFIANSKIMYQPFTKGKNGFVNFRFGLRNTKTNYQIRLERHQFNTNKGTKIHTTHFNYGTQGKNHFFMNKAKSKQIKL